MFRDIHKILLIIAFFYVNRGRSDKYWIDGFPNFNSLSVWFNNKLPCSQDKIVFPEIYNGAMTMPKQSNLDSIILSKDGAILMGKDSSISFSSGQNDYKRSCSNSNNLAKILQAPKPKSWFDYNNWSPEKKAKKFNLATPHVERIPCATEKAIIDTNGVVSIDMENMEVLEIGGMNMGGKEMASSAVHAGFFTSFGQTIFQNAEDIEVEFQPKTCSCHSSETFDDYKIEVCRFVSCNEEPKCILPILPKGFCCKICGGMVKLKIGDCKFFHMQTFKDLVKNAIDKEDLSRYVDFHASVIDENKEKFVQLVVVDSGKYNEWSTNFIRNFNESILKESYSSLSKTFYMSGMHYDKDGSSFVFVYVPLIFVIAFFIVIYVYYHPENPYITVPPWLYPNRYDVFRTPLAFARFDNNNRSDGQMRRSSSIGGGNLVVNVNFNEDENMVIPEEDVGARGFDNPLFSEEDKNKNDDKHIEDLHSGAATELIEINLSAK